MRILRRIPILPAIIAGALALSGCSEEAAQNAADSILPLIPEAPVTEVENPPVVNPETNPEVTPEVPEPPVTTPEDPPFTPVEPPTPPEPPIEVNPGPDPEPTGIISEVAIDEIQGVFTAGAPPTPIGNINLSPLSVTNEPVQFISGGSTQVPLQSDVPFVTVYVVVDPEGYFQLNLPTEKLEADLVITFSTLQLEGQLDEIAVSVESAVGDISGAEMLPVTSVVVGTGELQVSMSWDTPTDMDLYLVEPDGTEIYFGNKVSASGGTLDLDSNILCIIDGVNNENITYENVVPPSGEYTVGVSYYSDCNISQNTNFLVTVRIGNDVQTFSGSLNASDVGIVYEITRFEVR